MFQCAIDLFRHNEKVKVHITYKGFMCVSCTFNKQAKQLREHREYKADSFMCLDNHQVLVIHKILKMELLSSWSKT